MMKHVVLITVILLVPQIYSRKSLNFDVGGDVLGLTQYRTNEAKIGRDLFTDIADYLSNYNYPLETHEVNTDDGFILTLHRIPAGANQTASNTAKPVALLVHGMVCSGYDWVNTGPNRALALLMADTGYDVWLLSTRGSRYSMNHQTLNKSDAKFWDYSFHEKGYYDLPSSIDYILNSTGLSSLTLIGHSEGTSASMALTITKPEYNDKINLLVFLSPVGYMGGVRSPFVLLLVKYLTQLKLVTNLLNIHGLPYSPEISKLAVQICSIDGFEEICANIIFNLCGDDSDQLDLDTFFALVADKPAGIGFKQMGHYLQEISTGTFRRYDYGAILNMIHYGNMTPPAYDPSKITAPVAAYYSKNDFMAAVSDVEYLLEQIPNKVDSYLVEYEKFNHLDFMISKNIKELLYDRVLSVIQKYNPIENNEFK